MSLNLDAEEENGEIITEIITDAGLQRGTERIVHSWVAQEIEALISAYRVRKDEFNNKKHKPTWDAISGDLAKQGIHVSGLQCDNKWKNLTRMYRVTKERYQKTGKMTYFKYFNDMEELIGDKVDSPVNEDEEVYLIQPVDLEVATASDGRHDGSKTNRSKRKFLHNQATMKEFVEMKKLCLQERARIWEEKKKQRELDRQAREVRHLDRLAMEKKKLDLIERYLKLQEMK